MLAAFVLLALLAPPAAASDELLNDGCCGVVIGPLTVYGNGTVAKGSYRFQPKQNADWSLQIRPAVQAVANCHALGRAGGPIWLNCPAAVSDDGEWHHSSTSGWLSVALPPYGTGGNDLRAGDPTYLVVHARNGNEMWVCEAGSTASSCVPWCGAAAHAETRPARERR